MTPDLVIASLEKGDTGPLRKNAGLAGISQAYFERVATLLGTTPDRVRPLFRQFRMVLKYGDREDYAWRARGGALRGMGRWRESADSFLHAGQAAQEPADKFLFRLGAIDSYARAGRTDRSVSVGRAAARGLEKLGEPVLAARARLNLANALVWEDRYREAIREYERVLELEVSDYEEAAAQLGLSTAFLFHGKTRHVRALAESAQQGFTALEMPHFANLARLNIAHVSILQGRAEEAWAILRDLAPLFESTDEHSRVLEFQADAALALNLNESALELYLRARSQMRNPLNVANCLLGEARAEVAIGNISLAQPSFSKAVTRYRRVGNAQWELVARMERAVSVGNRRELHRVAVAFQKGASRYWEASAWLHLAALGDSSGLARASQIIQVNGYVNLLWRLRWMQARQKGTLSAYRRMAKALLADRLTTVSIAARMGFLRDKREAMLEYVRLLLARGKPQDIREVVEFVQQTRSAALLDELAGGSEFKPLLTRVESIRQSIREGGPEGARRAVARAVTGSTTELDRILTGHMDHVGSRLSGDLWIDLGDHLAALAEDSCRTLSAERIKSSLRWLWFEMMAPLTDRMAPAGPVLKLVDLLRTQLGTISSWVCPDGALWAAPWAVLAEGETTIALNPAFGHGHLQSLPPNPRIAIWYHEAADLPAISSEVAALKSVFPNAVLCGNRRDAVRSLTEKWNYIHVATHARLNSSNPMFSYFEFADGPLFAIEVSRSNVEVDLAVLAACDTGKLDLTLRDEPDGIVRAFLARRAKSVVAGQWPLDDEAAAIMMSAFAAKLASGESAVASLAHARAATREQFPHPYFWGPLVHFAGYQTQRRPFSKRD